MKITLKYSIYSVSTALWVIWGVEINAFRVMFPDARLCVILSEGDGEILAFKKGSNYKVNYMKVKSFSSIQSIAVWQMRPKIGVCFHLKFVAAL